MNEIYLIDVDDVLFNTPQLKTRLAELAVARNESVDDLQRPELLQALVDVDPEFLPSLVFTGGKEFLDKYKNSCFLISSARSSKSSEPATEQQIQFQKLKIKLCGLEDLVGGENNVRVTPDGKETALAEFKDKKALFIDNDIKHLRSAKEIGIDVVHMQREYMKNSGKPEATPETCPFAKFTVHSFAQLLELLNKTETQIE